MLMVRSKDFACLPRDFGASCFSIPLSLKTRHVRRPCMREIKEIYLNSNVHNHKYTAVPGVRQPHLQAGHHLESDDVHCTNYY